MTRKVYSISLNAGERMELSLMRSFYLDNMRKKNYDLRRHMEIANMTDAAFMKLLLLEVFAGNEDLLHIPTKEDMRKLQKKA